MLVLILKIDEVDVHGKVKQRTGFSVWRKKLPDALRMLFWEFCFCFITRSYRETRNDGATCQYAKMSMSKVQSTWKFEFGIVLLCKGAYFVHFPYSPAVCGRMKINTYVTARAKWTDVMKKFFTSFIFGLLGSVEIVRNISKSTLLIIHLYDIIKLFVSIWTLYSPPFCIGILKDN